VVHALAVEGVVHVALLEEQLGRENAVEDLRFLEAENVGLLLANQLLDQRDPRSNRVDVPGGDFQALGLVSRLACS
jgi:hypothetical protein